jgi:hypothetical protein
MLSQIRLRPRNPKAFALMRCSLGYALRGDEAVAKCLAVEGPAECWKTAQNWRVSPSEARQPTIDTRHVAGITDTTEDEQATSEDNTNDDVVGFMIEGTVEVVEVVHAHVVATRQSRRRRSR